MEKLPFEAKTHLGRWRQGCLLFPGLSTTANRSASNGGDLPRIRQHQNKQTISQTIAPRQFQAATANCGRWQGDVIRQGGVGLSWRKSVWYLGRVPWIGFALVWMQNANRYVPDIGPSSVSCQKISCQG